MQSDYKAEFSEFLRGRVLIAYSLMQRALSDVRTLWCSEHTSSKSLSKFSSLLNLIQLSAKFLKSQPTAKFTVQRNYRADLSAFLPEGALTASVSTQWAHLHVKILKTQLCGHFA